MPQTAPSLRTATLRAVAREAGYALVTVSYALRDHPRVQEATRRKIQAVAQEMGYRPNPLVTAVMAHVRSANPPRHGGTIACLARWSEAADELNLAAVSQFLRGARQRAESLGWRIDEIACDNNVLRGPRLAQILINRGIHGVLVGPLPLRQGEIGLDWSRFACATWGYSLRNPVLHRAVVHHGHSIGLAFHHALAAGAKRIGFAAPARINARADFSYEAACHIQQRRLPAVQRVAPFLPADRDWTKARFQDWLRREQPDVVVTPHDIRSWLGNGSRKARRPGLITLDKTGNATPGAGVDYCHEAVGAAAVDLIIAQINANERGLPRHAKLVMIEGRWVEGKIFSE